MRETMTADEAAELLGLSRWTIYDLARKRQIPHVRIGQRRLLFRRASLLRWLEENENPAARRQTGERTR